jgi:hypothetical protein
MAQTRIMATKKKKSSKKAKSKKQFLVPFYVFLPIFIGFVCLSLSVIYILLVTY